MNKLMTGGIAMAMAITANAAELTATETAIVDIGAWTARGEQDKLGAACVTPTTAASRCFQWIHTRSRS